MERRYWGNLALTVALTTGTFFSRNIKPVFAGGGCYDGDCAVSVAKIVRTPRFEITAYNSKNSLLHDVTIYSRTHIWGIPFLPSTDEGYNEGVQQLRLHCETPPSNLRIFTGPANGRLYVLETLDCLDPLEQINS